MFEFQNIDDEITYCMETCVVADCIRNKIHAPYPSLPHCYAEFKVTKYCPTLLEKKESDKEEDMWPWGNMELGNLIYGNSRGNYPILRDKAQDYFGEFFEAIGCDVYGHPEASSPIYSYLTPLSEDGEMMIDTEVFSLFPYYWGDKEELMYLPNFVYKPENIAIQWYKYPLRDSYSNVKLDAEKIREILEKCTEYVKDLPKK